MKIIDIYSDNRTAHLNELCGDNLRVFFFRYGGAVYTATTVVYVIKWRM